MSSFMDYNETLEYPDNETIDNEDERHQRLAAYLSLLAKDAASAWRTLSSRDRVDKEFVLPILRRATTLPSKSELERQFPQTLRFDRDVVLAFCARPDFEELFYERHLYVPDCLINDKEVMLAYCRKIPRSLQECSEELCDDEDVVHAAIALDGLELQYASLRLQEDEALLRAACSKDGRALGFCPSGPVRDKLTADRTFMLQVLRQQGGSMLQLVAEPLKRDRELILTALVHGGLRLRFCPLEYQTDDDFLKDAVSINPDLYLELPRALQTHEHLALAAVTAATSTHPVHRHALECVPNLVYNRYAVLSIARSGDEEFVKTLFQQQVPAHFRDDKEIVLLVLQKSIKLFNSASDRLQKNPDVLLAAIDDNTAVDILRDLDAVIQQAHPEIVIKAISCSSKRTLNYLRTFVQPFTLWRNRNIAIAWIRRGCCILEPFEYLLSDEEVALEIAEHTWLQFGHVSAQLRNNLGFMTRAVDTNGRVLRYASPSLQKNMDLVIRAIANTPDVLLSCQVSKQDLLTHVQQQLELHTIFLRDFLGGIAIASPGIHPTRRNYLQMLDRGVETSQAFKQLIAGFLGVPVGNDLRLLRQAHHNINSGPPAPRPPVPNTEDNNQVLDPFLMADYQRRAHLRVNDRVDAGEVVNDALGPVERQRRRNHQRPQALRYRRHAANIPLAAGNDADARARARYFSLQERIQMMMNRRDNGVMPNIDNNVAGALAGVGAVAPPLELELDDEFEADLFDAGEDPVDLFGAGEDMTVATIAREVEDWRALTQE